MTAEPHNPVDVCPQCGRPFDTPRPVYGLTPRARELMLKLQRTVDATGTVPSFDELRRMVGISSRSGIHRMLGQLEERGYIRRIKSRARAIQILKRIQEGETNASSAMEPGR